MNVFRARKGEKVSLTRVMSFMVVITILAIFAAWSIKAMIIGGDFVSVGNNETYLLLIALGAKVTQNIFGEKAPAATTEEKPAAGTPTAKPTETPVNGPG